VNLPSLCSFAWVINGSVKALLGCSERKKEKEKEKESFV